MTDISTLSTTQLPLAESIGDIADFVANGLDGKTRRVGKNLVVPPAAIPAGSIQGAQLADGAVSSGKLSDAAATESKIADGAVTTGKVADAAIDVSKIANEAVTAVKLAPSAVQLDGPAILTAVPYVILRTNGLGRPVWVEDDIVVAPSGGDDTIAIQAALDAAGIGGTTRLRPGIFTVSDTLTMQTNQRLVGAGANRTLLQRMGDYGSTILAEAALGLTINGIWFKHGIEFSGPPPEPLLNVATSGAHLSISGAQWCTIEDCWFTRMPYGIHFAGGSWQSVVRCLFFGYAPEAVASMLLDGVTSMIVEGRCQFLGGVRNLGPQYGILISAAEDLNITNNFFGDHTESCVYAFQQVGEPMLDIRLLGNQFDDCGGTHVVFNAAAAGTIAQNVIVNNNVFNGENNAQRALQIATVDGQPTVNTMTRVGNTFNGFTEVDPVILDGAINCTSSGNSGA